MEYLGFGEKTGVRGAISNEILKVHLRTFHDDVSILALGVLVGFLQGHEVPKILDHIIADFREFLHVIDFLQEALVLVVIFYLDLFEGEDAIPQQDLVDVGVAPADFLQHPNILQAEIPFHQRVLTKQV